MSHRGRRSIRLKKYDYRSNALYFVTICTNRKDIIFGQIKNDKLILNDFGKIARREWIKTTRIRTYVELDAFIIMPDHIHGIILINENNHDQCRGMACHAHFKNNTYLAPNNTRHATCYGCNTHFKNNTKMIRKFSHPIKQSLSTIIGAYKSAVTKEINKLRNKSGRSVWQRNYYEHIIRNEKELFAVRQYIIANPKKLFN
jgi:putative transposase